MRYALTRLPDRGIACWAVVGIAGLAAAVVCFRPMLEIGIGASIGARVEQRGFDYDRVLTPVADLRPWSLLMLAAALLLLVTSVTALIWGNRPIRCSWPVPSRCCHCERCWTWTTTRLAGVRRCERVPRNRRAARCSSRRSKISRPMHARSRKPVSRAGHCWVAKRGSALAASTAGGCFCGSRSSSRSSRRSGFLACSSLPGRRSPSRRSGRLWCSSGSSSRPSAGSSERPTRTRITARRVTGGRRRVPLGREGRSVPSDVGTDEQVMQRETLTQRDRPERRFDAIPAPGTERSVVAIRDEGSPR